MLKHLGTNSWVEFDEEFKNVYRTIDRLIIEAPSPKSARRPKQTPADARRDIMPVTRMVNAVEIEEWRQKALDHGRQVAKLLLKRRLTREFAMAWGDFQYACGMVVSAFALAQEDASRKIESLANETSENDPPPIPVTYR